MNGSPPPTRRIMLEVAEGRGAGALLENGFLDMCREAGLEAHVLTPGARFSPFVERYGRDGVRFSYLPVDRYGVKGRWPGYECRLGDWLVRSGRVKTRRLLWSLIGERIAAGRAGQFGELVRREKPDAFISTNITVGFDLGMVAVARRLGIPTLGNVFSWDHPYRRQAARPDLLTCWSEWVKDGLVERQGYDSEQIEVVGAPAFDPYFREDCIWSRERLCQELSLDLSRPLVLFASLGQMMPFLDETGTFRAMMAAIDDGRIAGKPQIILRLHPLSMEYYFEDYLHRPDVALSRFVGYCPGMRWWPRFNEVVLAANILRHADVCVSPGSTITIETAMFDLPTIIPVFNPYTTAEHESYFRNHWLDRHFKFIVDDGLLPVVRSADELADAVNRVLRDRVWDASGQQRIRERVLGPLDGNSTQRLADAAIRVAQHGLRR